MLKCPFCHFENEDGALFCEQCKSDLGLAEPALSDQVGPGTGGAAPQEGHAFSAVPEPITPLAADMVSEPHVVETIPVAEVAGSSLGGVGEEAPLAGYPVVDTIPMAAPVETPDSMPPVAVPVAAPVAEDERTATETTTQTESAGAAAVTFPAGTTPKLVVVRGLRLNIEYPLYEGDNYIGRADEKAVDVDLEDQEPEDRVWSSRQHALITFDDGRLAIEDLNSMNGTYVNRLRVNPGQKRPLQVNDVIQIGTVHLRVKT